jgi:hypothetical protein
VVGVAGGWRCCWLNWCWDKPVSEAAMKFDLRFTIYDLKNAIRNPNFLWLLLVLPALALRFFWWASNAAAEIAGAIHSGAVAVRADRRHFAPARRKIRFAAWFLAVALLISRWRGRSTDLICRKSNSAAWTSWWRWTLPNPCWRRTSRRTGSNAPSSPRWN